MWQGIQNASSFPDNYAVIADVTSYLLKRQVLCENISRIDEEFAAMNYALGLQKNSVYNEVLSAA